MQQLFTVACGQLAVQCCTVVHPPLPALPTFHIGHAQRAVCAALQGVRVWHQLHRSRIGLVGQPSSWCVLLTTCIRPAMLLGVQRVVGMNILV